jgi:ABC-2 type transport system permease protein
MASRKVNFNLTFTATACLLFGIAVTFVAVVSLALHARVDLTSDKTYTVSPAAKRILTKLAVPVQIKVYMTGENQMPTQWKTLERDVVDKLKEFRVASGGKLSFSVIDPSDNDDLKEKLSRKGIRPLQVSSVERDEMAVKLIYSAIAVAYKEKQEEVIPQVVPQSLETFEYQICNAVSKLTRQKDPVVAVYTSKPEMDPQVRMLYMQMGQQPPEPPDVYKSIGELLKQANYEIRPTQISESSPIPDDASTLLLLAPRHLDARQRYEINRFIHRGGSAILAVQRYEYDYNPGRSGGFNISATSIDSGLDELLTAYGVKVSDKLFMDANMAVLQIPRSENMGMFQVQVAEPIKAPMQIRVNGDQLNNQTSITNRISEILYLWGSRLLPDESKLGAGKVELTPLFSSTKQSWEVDYSGGPITAASIQSDPTKFVGPAPLAVMLRGALSNPYETGTIPPWAKATPDSNPPPPKPVELFEPKESKLVVVGCAQMFTDNLLGVAGNAMFLMNAVDAVTLGNDLIEIRGKSITQRVIAPVSSQKKLAVRLFSTVLVPVVIAIYGILRMVRRRREEAAYLAAQAG